MSYTIPECRSCGRRVFWVKTVAREGKPSRSMPVDADVNGDPIEYPDGGVVRTGTIEPNGAPVVTVRKGESGYRSHFASCPEREGWRRKR